MASPIRILTAVPICDGHDSAINTINLEFIRHGIEVIYLGYHRSVGDIVRAAIQEDVRAVGISSYNGGHVEFFAEVVDLLRKRYGRPRRKRSPSKSRDIALARELTEVEDSYASRKRSTSNAQGSMSKGKIRNPKSEIRN